MQSPRTITDERFSPKQDPKIMADPPQGIGKKDNIMAPRRHAEADEYDDSVAVILAELRLLRDAQSKPSTWIDRWIPFIGSLLIVGVGWIANGIYIARGTEGDLKTQIAVLSEKIAQSEERQKERERVADRERALINEQNRQISIQLEAHGIKIPKQ